jgi:chromosome segregation ATPase
LLALIRQSDNLNVKIRAISEYNKLKKRYEAGESQFEILIEEKKSTLEADEKDLDELLMEFYN